MSEIEAGGQESPGEALPEVEFVPTTPVFPVEVVLKSFSWWIQRYPDGARELKFAGTVMQPTPAGMQQSAIPPGYSILFPNEEVWERFQEHVAASEVPNGPAIQTAPAGALDALRERRAADTAALRHR